MGRALAAAALLALLLLLPGCGDAPVERPRAATTAAPGTAPRLPDPAEAAAPPAAEPRLPDPRTVRRALRRALLTGHLTEREHAAHRRTYRAARRALRRLTGVRHAELAAVVGQVRALAAARRLSTGRLELAMLLLRRNTALWSRGPVPAAGARLEFARDPLVFRYYPGHGVQLQPLASAGRASAAARICLAERAGRPHRGSCRPRGLRKLLDRMLDVATPAHYLAWESWFPFGGARPGWVSAMTQGTAAQALARGARALDAPRYLRAARSAVIAFERRPPLGVALDAPGGRHFAMYSTLPGLRILNGHLQAVTGLRDVAALGGGRRAWRAFRRGDRAARQELDGYDTGAWSLYSAGGAEADLGYHRLMRTQLDGLCRRTRAGAYCRAGRAFARYLREPPRVQLAVARRVRPGRPTRVAFHLNKVSQVRVTLADRRGWSLVHDLRLPRGRHQLPWRPPHRGRYRVSVRAAALSGPRAELARTVLVRRSRAELRAVARRRAKARAEARRAQAERRRSAHHGAQVRRAGGR